ncbi:MAG: molybdopterin-dependent oxidoreductase [Acidimicrobiales bacterium]
MTTRGLHEQRTAALVGIALGIAFTLCFATGLLSHLIQYPPSWFAWPSRPAGLYRITQGVHTICGFVSIPLLLAKLWIVYPKLFEWPPVRSVVHGLERLSLLPLVGGGLFMVMSGTANVARWYPWTFFFPTAHYWVAWVTFGALAVHLGAKWLIVREQVGPRSEARLDAIEPDRRRFLGGLAATAGITFLAVAGNTIRPLSRVAALAQRRPGTGPQGVPVNKSAHDAGGVRARAHDPGYRLVVEGRVGRRLELTLADLQAMPQRSATLPIACVEGWSTSARWTGVPVRDLLEAAGAAATAVVAVESFQKGGLYRRSDLGPSHANDPDTLLALRLDGEPLHIDHGFPVRLIGPNRPGVLQTKWVERLVVS